VRSSKQCPICQIPVPKFKYIPNYAVDKIVCEVKILKEQLSKHGIISENFADTLTQKEKSFSQVDETDEENEDLDLVQNEFYSNKETVEFDSPQINALQAINQSKPNLISHTGEQSMMSQCQQVSVYQTNISSDRNISNLFEAVEDEKTVENKLKEYNVTSPNLLNHTSIQNVSVSPIFLENEIQDQKNKDAIICSQDVFKNAKSYPKHKLKYINDETSITPRNNCIDEVSFLQEDQNVFKLDVSKPKLSSEHKTNNHSQVNNNLTQEKYLKGKPEVDSDLPINLKNYNHSELLSLHGTSQGSDNPFKRNNEGKNKKDYTQAKTNKQKVQCPICHRGLSINQINKHLDDICIPSKDKKSNLRKLQSSISYNETKIKNIDHEDIDYKVLTKSELKSVARRLKINTKGSKDAIIRRHKNFLKRKSNDSSFNECKNIKIENSEVKNG